MQPPPAFFAVANWCIRKFAYTIEPGFATIQGDSNALHFMATKIIHIMHGFMRIALSRLWQREFLSSENSTSTHYTLCWMSEHRTRKLPILSSDEAMQNSVVPDEVMSINLLVAVPHLLKLFDTSTTHVSWYYSDRRTMIRRQSLIVHELSKYENVSAVHGIME